MSWGFIRKSDRTPPGKVWVGVEVCDAELQGGNRAAELERADPLHRYQACPHLSLPLFVTFRGRRATP